MQQRRANQFGSIRNTSMTIEEDALDTQNMNDEQQEMKACEAWKEHLFNNRSIVVDLFQG